MLTSVKFHQMRKDNSNGDEQMRKSVISAGALAVVTPLLLVGAASQANAAPALRSCTASQCTGQPAADYTCVNDAEVIYSLSIKNGSTVVGNIQLKYSPSCRATWARVISNLSNGSFAEIKDVEVPSLLEDCFGTSGPGTGCNTDMINDATTPTQTLTSTAQGAVNINVAGNEVSQTTPAF
jgi:hypothetical protein